MVFLVLKQDVLIHLILVTWLLCLPKLQHILDQKSEHPTSGNFLNNQENVLKNLDLPVSPNLILLDAVELLKYKQG